MNPTLLDAREGERCHKEVMLLDVRTSGEFGAEHICGAESMPLDRVDIAVVKGWIAERGRCVVICQSGKRASMAADRLANAGVPDVGVLAGGINAWKEAGFPVIRGRGVISIERQVRIAAGALVLAGVVCGFVVAPWFFALSAFVGAGLVFAGITDFCGMGILLAKMPWNQRSGKGCRR